MKLLSIATTSVLCLGFVSTAVAQQRLAARPTLSPPPQAQGMRIALVDMAVLFEGHPRHKQQLQAIRDEVARFDAQVKEKQKQMRALVEKRNELKPTSREYKEYDRKLAQLGTSLQVQSQMKRKEIIEREAHAYLNTFNELQAVIRQVCKQHQISLALRFDSKPVDESSPSAILKKVNRSILHQEGIDITPLVLSQIK